MFVQGRPDGHHESRLELLWRHLGVVRLVLASLWPLPLESLLMSLLMALLARALAPALLEGWLGEGLQLSRGAPAHGRLIALLVGLLVPD